MPPQFAIRPFGIPSERALLYADYDGFQPADQVSESTPNRSKVHVNLHIVLDADFRLAFLEIIATRRCGDRVAMQRQPHWNPAVVLRAELDAQMPIEKRSSHHINSSN